MNDRIEKALRNVFMSWYDVSERPESLEEWAARSLERSAAHSVVYLRRDVGDELVPELASVMRAASREREGPVVQQIESWTRMVWSEDDVSWSVLSQLLVKIADLLEAPRTT